MTTEPTQADLSRRKRIHAITGYVDMDMRLAKELAAHRIASTAALQARVETLEAALVEMIEAVCGETGFAQAVRADSGFAYPWPALDMAEVKARKALGGNDA